MNKKILVFGLGYVGLSNALVLAKNNSVVGIDIDSNKIKFLKNKISPIKEQELQNYLSNEQLSFDVSDKYIGNYEYDYIIIATPTNYDEGKNYFDTSSIECILNEISAKGTNALIIIKSTIPIGFTRLMNSRFKNLNIIFSPEFLREGHALNDNLFPSRIVVGVDNEINSLVQMANNYALIMEESSLKLNVDKFIVNYEEAECSKLFANTYLAMRVSFFNELDNYACISGLNTKNIIECVCSDDRIGNYYNNPSFGYGGYCLPKDTKQLASEFCLKSIPNSLIRNITDSNLKRKKFIVSEILNKTKKDDVIGIYKLAMKSNSDNSRSSAVLDIIDFLSKKRNVLIYEPTISDCFIDNCKFTKNISEFKEKSKLIVCNRCDNCLLDVKFKIYTRDIFGEN